MIVGVVVAGAFIALLNQTVMGPALPALMSDFQITEGTVQWVTSIYMLISGIMVPISGYLIDKFSTRKLFLSAMLAFVVGTVICAAAPNFIILLIGRVLQAAGSGVLLPLVAVVPMLVFPPEKRGTAMGMAGIVMSAGPAVGPVVGGIIIDGMGWRAMFWCIAPLAALIAAGVVLLKNVGELKCPKLNVASVILSTVAFGGMLYGFSSASTMGWASPVVIISIVVGVIALVAFVVKQRHLAEPLLQIKTLATTNFRWAAILVTLINAAAAVTAVTLPIYLQNVLGVSAFTTGMVMLPSGLLGIIISPISGMIFDKYGPKAISIIGLVVFTVGLAALSQVGVGTSVIAVAVYVGLQAAGQGLANMPINTWGVNALPNNMIAHGNAIANTGRQVLGAISTAIIVTTMTSVTASHQSAGAKAASATGVDVSYGICAAIALLALVICVIAMRDEKFSKSRD
jgi:EmrB/QacA subfamily drug resistance transporter